MSITANVGGTLKKLTKITANVSGTLKNLKLVHTNVNGVLKEIFVLNTTFKVIKGTLKNNGGKSATGVTDTNLTNVVIPRTCTANIKVHIDSIGDGNNSRVRQVEISGSVSKTVKLTSSSASVDENSDWYGETQLATGTYNFSIAVFNVSVSNAGTPNISVGYSSSTITYEISFS